LLVDRRAEVRTAASASDAILSLAADLPHVLVSDIGMPGEDGYSLIRRVRAMTTSQGGELPAVAVTAFARDEDRRQAISAGFQAHIAKPVDAAELLRVIARLAGRPATAAN
jgi:CheY-like chemotaxis protein